MYRVRLPKVGELVEFCSLFKEERIMGIVTWVPSEEEVIEKLKRDSSVDAFFFKVMTKDVQDDYWTEYEWNYVEENVINEDVETKKD
jgi:hypothetical protein